MDRTPWKAVPMPEIARLGEPHQFWAVEDSEGCPITTTDLSQEEAECIANAPNAMVLDHDACFIIHCALRKYREIVDPGCRAEVTLLMTRFRL